MLVQSVSFNFTYRSPGLLAGGSVRCILARDDSERLKRKENKFYVKTNHHWNDRVNTPFMFFAENECR